MSPFSTTLPAGLQALGSLARNFRWSWHAETARLFEQLDPALWEATNHNPVRLLQEIDPVRLEAAARSESYVAELNAGAASLDGYLNDSNTWFQRTYPQLGEVRIAYFSAEFAITESLRIFSGGLGVLAGDHLKSASDLGVPLVGVGLFYHDGYFTQRMDANGKQHDVYTPADPRKLPVTLETRFGAPLLVEFPYLDRQLHAQVWRADVGRVALYLLDTDVPQNRAEDRHITDRLYGGNNEHRLRQEIVLGIGGMRALAALGVRPTVLHLNEGHAAFAAVERVRQVMEGESGTFAALAERMSGGVAFTTHTPVPAGHDFFPADLMERYLGGYVWEMREPWQRFLALGRHDPADLDESFNMTLLALRMSGRRNGVSELHGEVSRKMWKGVWQSLHVEDVPIGHITNGVHLPTWAADSIAQMYAKYLGGEWADSPDEFHWNRISDIPNAEIWNVRTRLRLELIEHVRELLAKQLTARRQDANWAKQALDPNALTIVFARRFATYKRATLLLQEPERLIRLIRERNVQFIFAGKAHPRDEPGQEFLRRIFEFAARQDVRDRFVFLEEYDPHLARMLTGGADVWLNVPRRPYEASGTSGMKSAANGGLNLSILDGWWAEAWTDHNRLPHPPGWAIDAHAVDPNNQDEADAQELYRLLEQSVVPLFYERDIRGVPNGWCERVRSALRQLVPYFNTHRMVSEYVARFYVPSHEHTMRITGAGSGNVAASA